MSFLLLTQLCNCLCFICVLNKFFRFDFTKCKKFGFGIKGEWLSEYIPSKTSKFFATCDGIEVWLNRK